jgi:50S ribosomal protein L16 3-hydroxylase
MTKTLLAGLTVAEFLHRHWQKRPLLVRGALPECGKLIRRKELLELATREDLESRLVQRQGRRWQVRHGPFDRRELQRLPRSGWTLLVQGVNHALPAAQHLLDGFSFIPYARLDDLMVSYAPPGGGVGPHFDNYDVFLLQGEGRRRWRVSRQRDLEMVAGAPLKILRRFRPAQEWILETGDMLYLPPRCAHDGVAMDGDCITYSIGFRAPDAQELGARFLDYLQDRLRLSGIYADPGLVPARHPGRLGDDMVRHAQAVLQRIRWNGGDVAQFLGCHLTEPKPHVVFSRPPRPRSARAFTTRLASAGVHLALPTRMLFRGATVFINGEARRVGTPASRLLSQLADRRSLPPRSRPDREAAQLLYQWYRDGYICLANSDE